MRKKAFTLAEVLITLVIIGVIAAITVPSLIQSTNKQEYVSALQKAYSTLSQATNQIIAEEGSPKCQDAAGNETGWACSSKNIYDIYKKHLVLINDCGNSFDQKCFHNSVIKLLSNNPVTWNPNSGGSGVNYKVVLSDGISLMFYGDISKTCSGFGGDACAAFIVDVNGHKKPNQYGRDVFWISLTENGAKPSYCKAKDEWYTCVKDDGSFGTGYSCACKILREGAMNY